MKITWKDGITTLSTAGAVVLERAFFHDWDLPLIANMRWTIAGLAVLMAISFLFSYVLDEAKGAIWSWVAGFLGATAVVLTGLGMYYNTTTDYVVLLMLNIVAFWFSAVVRHITVDAPVTRSHA